MGLFDMLFGRNKNFSQQNQNTQLNKNEPNPQSVSAVSRNSSSLDLSKQSMLNLSKEDSLNQLNLKKDIMQSLCLEKNVNNLTARVAVVMDFSGSMEILYRNGTVQAILDRLLPVAMQFDDNGEMEVWLFSNNCVRMPDISLNNYYDYLQNEGVMRKYRMSGTQYAPVINDVVNKYTVEDTSQLPTLVLFITDGDNSNSDKPRATQAIINSSKHPIFWQFVGIGDASFEYLEELDEMGGRYVDNANFFSINDLMSIDDNVLYNRLLDEYPHWISKVKDLGMIK